MPTNIEEHLQHYFRSNLKIRSEQTKKIYRLALANLGAALHHPPGLEDLTDDNCVAMIHHLLDQGKAIPTVNERRSRLHAFWTWCAKKGLVAHWPTTPPLDEPQKIPLAWTEEELHTLLKASRKATGCIGTIPAAQWWYSLHLAMWDTGERIGALMKVGFRQLSGEWLHVKADQRKKGIKPALYELSPETLAAINQIRNPKRELIWHWPYDPTYLWGKYKRLREQAGLPTDRESAFHRMRKSFASHLEAHGGNATEALGHSSRALTKKRYLDPRIVSPPQPMKLLPRIADGA